MTNDLCTQYYNMFSKPNNEKANNPIKNRPMISTEASIAEDRQEES